MGSPTRSLPQVPHASDPLLQTPPHLQQGRVLLQDVGFYFSIFHRPGHLPAVLLGQDTRAGALPSHSSSASQPLPSLVSYTIPQTRHTHFFPEACLLLTGLPLICLVPLTQGMASSLDPLPGYLSTSTLFLSMTPCLLTFLPTLTSSYFPSLLPTLLLPPSCSPSVDYSTLPVLPLLAAFFLDSHSAQNTHSGARKGGEVSQGHREYPLGRRGWAWGRSLSLLSLNCPNLGGGYTGLEESCKSGTWLWRKRRYWGGSPHLQRLHVLVNPSGLFLQAGDGVFGTDQSAVDPTLGKNGRRWVSGCVGANRNPKQKVKNWEEARFTPRFCPGMAV